MIKQKDLKVTISGPVNTLNQEQQNQYEEVKLNYNNSSIYQQSKDSQAFKGLTAPTILKAAKSIAFIIPEGQGNHITQDCRNTSYLYATSQNCLLEEFDTRLQKQMSENDLSRLENNKRRRKEETNLIERYLKNLKKLNKTLDRRHFLMRYSHENEVMSQSDPSVYYL